jgi:class 3 adenylate cyclase/tetratricopeptide (TPR) repeat protein
MNRTASAFPAGLSAERRLMTIMFCDLVGSTALASRLDPEDLREVLQAYQEQVSLIVVAAGGMVARYQGDGVLAYFGYPAASEDDAEHAVAAGLQLTFGLDSNGKLPARLGVRVGIATGVVLVDEVQPSNVADSPPVIGETANIAARLQELAEPNAVVICDTTHRQVRGLFDHVDLGLQRAKGLLEPMQAWQVLRRGRTASRFQALRSREQPCIGRDSEMAFLLGRWAEAKTGKGSVTVVSGDAGIGKSRVALELIATVRRQNVTVLRYNCSPHHRNSVLHPILEHVRRAARSQAGDDAVREQLRRFLPDTDEQTSTAVALLSELMDTSAGSSVPDANVDAQRRRELLFDALISNLQRLSSLRPVLILVEDAHWIDPTSGAVLDLFVERMADWPIMLVMTCRPEYAPAWFNKEHAARLELKPIGMGDAQLLVRGIAGVSDLPPTVVYGIAERAGGIPLYLEELTRAVVDSGGSPSGGGSRSVAIPSSLHASLTARLDRLGKARDVVRVVAAIGREFTFDLLRAVVPDRAAEDLRTALRQLVDADLLSSPEQSSPETYAFRHALIQDTAYGMLPRDERKALHRRVALALQDQFPETVAAQPEIAADHFTKAGLAEQASRHWMQAGHRAVRGSALTDAVKHYTEAMRLVRELPPSASRDQAELQMYLALGPAVMATSGYAASETLQVFLRARELTTPSTAPAERLEVLAGLFNVHYGRAELEQALAIARQHLALSQESGLQKARSHCFMGQTYSAMGAFGDARNEFERALAIFADNPEDTRALGVYGSQHVVALAFLAGVYWAQGDAGKATASTAHSIDQANQSGHLISIALALITRLLTPIPGGLKGDASEAEETTRFCAQYGLSNFEVWARFAHGAVSARRGEVSDGIKVMQAAISAAEDMGSRLFRPVQFATVASAYARLGEWQKALALLDQAIAVARTTGERRADSALHRVRGEVLLASGRKKEGERELLVALDIAKAQQAKSEIDRATATLAKLAGGRGLRPFAGRRPLAALRSFLGV